MSKKIVDFIVRKNDRLNEEMFMLTLHSPELPELKPGQFVNVRVDGSSETFLRRPISVYDVDVENKLLFLLVKIAGAGTAKLATLQIGASLNIVLPLGNGFTVPTSGECLLVGGGVGIAPLLYLAKTMKKSGIEPSILLGFRSKENVVLEEVFSKYGKVYYTTEDGSYGEKGFPTQHRILTERKFDHIACCGPDPMMHAVARYAYANQINCEVSLENMMACGIGVCLCCVTETTTGHKCVCSEGSVFNIKDLKWQI